MNLYKLIGDTIIGGSYRNVYGGAQGKEKCFSYNTTNGR